MHYSNNLKHCLLTIFLISNVCIAVTEFATVEQRVVSSLRLQKISDMIFPDAVSGDGPYTIQPNNSDTLENASFKIFGEPGRMFRIILPRDGQVKMRLNNSFDNRSSISVNKFKSNFARGYGEIRNNGEQDLYIGATREALLFNQRSGLYRGRFLVTIIY